MEASYVDLRPKPAAAVSFLVSGRRAISARGALQSDAIGRWGRQKIPERCHASTGVPHAAT